MKGALDRRVVQLGLVHRGRNQIWIVGTLDRRIVQLGLVHRRSNGRGFVLWCGRILGRSRVLRRGWVTNDGCRWNRLEFGGSTGGILDLGSLGYGPKSRILALYTVR